MDGSGDPASPASLAARDDGMREEPPRERCTGTFTVFHPVPDQCLGDIETDRPHKTDTPHVVDPGHAQVELGVVEYEIRDASNSDANSVGLFNNGYKLGLVSGVDLQLLYASGAYDFASRRFEAGSDATLRAKVNLYGGNTGPLSATLVPAVVLPVRGAGDVVPGLLLFIGGELPAEIDAELNLGGYVPRDADTRRPFVSPVITTALTRPMIGPVSLFVELYNEATAPEFRSWNASLDAGVLVALGRDVQFDAGAYTALWGSLPDVTPFLGLSARR
jgi:hypothetical protein